MVKEKSMKKIKSFIGHELIKIIIGVRRCGKSYFLNLIIGELYARGISKENIFLINFNESPYKKIENDNDLHFLVDDLIKDTTGKVYLFFDEIDNVRDWEKSIVSFNTLYDCDIYITLPNSKIFSSRLTGRYTQIKLYPFSFKEFLNYKNNDSKSVDELFSQYLNYGGFALTHSLDEDSRKTYLNDLFSSILYNEVILKYKIRNVGLLIKLVDFLFDNVGEDFSVDKFLAKSNASKKTVYTYLNYLENAFLIYKIPNEDLESGIILSYKYYICDLGFIAKNIIENLVFLELLKRGYKISSGNIKSFKIDFVCENTDKLIYVQYEDYLNSDEKFDSLLLINDNYPKYVISRDKSDFSQKGIIHLNLMDFLKGVSTL